MPLALALCDSTLALRMARSRHRDLAAGGHHDSTPMITTVTKRWRDGRARFRPVAATTRGPSPSKPQVHLEARSRDRPPDAGKFAVPTPQAAGSVAMLAPMSYDDDIMATKKRMKDPPARGREDEAPSEEYFKETLGLQRLHIRLPIEDYDRLVKLADAAFPPKRKGQHQLRAYISELIDEKWQQRKR